MIPDDEVPVAAHDSVEQLFNCGFGGENLGPISDEAPLASFSTPVLVIPPLSVVAVTVPPQDIMTASTVPPSTTPTSTAPYIEVGSSSRSGAMRRIIIEVPAEDNLLRKSVHASLKVRALTSELAVEKASSNQARKEKARLETSFSEQLSKASEEIRELRALLSEKEAYAGELVQSLTQTQEDLRVSSDKVFSLENSHASLQSSYESALAKNEKLRNEIVDWERDYEILEDKTVIEENFKLESELAKIKETIEKTQQNQDFSSPVAEASKNVEDNTGIPTPSSQVEPTAAEDPASVPSSSQ
ncbi:uncharacterized protein [Nicotiana sylvestris]|uniref:uncharacterized protein n=1 Tax=Nicotiana sylvestris TaxID=4096 RepID=UPI00388CA2E0